MLDRKFIVENAELVKQNCINRGVPADVERFVALEAERRQVQADVEELNRKANELSKSIGKAKDAEEREARKEEGRALREQTSVMRTKLDELSADLDRIHRSIPNLSHPDAPVGEDDKANLERARGKTPLPEFDFEPVDHVVLGERLGLIDFEG
ncbi:MAG: serine--tRNA ligase, partial [Thermoguttaceae bacterium]